MSKRGQQLGPSNRGADIRNDDDKDKSAMTKGCGRVVSKIGNEGKESVSEVLSTKQAHELDLVSRVTFPVTFVLFNVLYWSYYLA